MFWVIYMQILAISAKFYYAKGQFERSKWDLVPLTSTRMTLTLKNNNSLFHFAFKAYLIKTKMRGPVNAINWTFYF